MNLQANIKAWGGDTHHHPGPQNAEMYLCQQSAIDAVLGLNGPILVHYWDHGQMISNTRYHAILEEELKPGICNICRRMLTNGVILYHDNAQPHMATETVETTQKPKFKLLPHPAYCLDLAPFYYHIFRLIKGALCGH
jgi:hypothetical protein